MPRLRDIPIERRDLKGFEGWLRLFQQQKGRDPTFADPLPPELRQQIARFGRDLHPAVVRSFTNHGMSRYLAENPTLSPEANLELLKGHLRYYSNEGACFRRPDIWIYQHFQQLDDRGQLNVQMLIWSIGKFGREGYQPRQSCNLSKEDRVTLAKRKPDLFTYLLESAEDLLQVMDHTKVQGHNIRGVLKGSDEDFLQILQHSRCSVDICYEVLPLLRANTALLAALEIPLVQQALKDNPQLAVRYLSKKRRTKKVERKVYDLMAPRSRPLLYGYLRSRELNAECVDVTLRSRFDVDTARRLRHLARSPLSGSNLARIVAHPYADFRVCQAAAMAYPRKPEVTEALHKRRLPKDVCAESYANVPAAKKKATKK